MRAAGVEDGDEIVGLLAHPATFAACRCEEAGAGCFLTAVAGGAGFWMAGAARVDRQRRCWGRVGGAAVGHLQYDLGVVAEVDRGQVRILLPPLGEVRRVGAVAGEELFVSEVEDHVG